MRFPRLFTCAVVAILAGCGSPGQKDYVRVPLHVDELGIPVHAADRSYMQSDRTGGFLLGRVGAAAGSNADAWSVDGVELLRGLRVEAGGRFLETPDSARIFPHEVRRWDGVGISVSIAPLELTSGGAHGLLVRVRSAHREAISLRPVAPGAPSGVAGRPDLALWSLPGGRRFLLSAGERGVRTEGGLRLPEATTADFLLLDLPPRADPATLLAGIPAVETLCGARAARMNTLLNESYFRSSDDTLTAAVQWIKLSLDALLLQREDTLVVAGVPWDGSFDLRANAQSIAGIGLATGDYARTGAILRSLARYQDTRPSSPAPGRIADRIAGGRPSFNGADVGPWFVRELYEHVVASNDTALVRALYPVIVRGLEGSYRKNTDRFNLLTHGPYETWMSGVPRGNRAAEVEFLWYFQQMIGSYVAVFLRDSVHARAWWDASVKTSDSFAEAFGDTSSRGVADFISATGGRDTVRRPNALMSAEILESETMRFEVTRAAARSVLRPYGIASRAGTGNAPFDGAAWTWLAGPAIYALTRYDRTDLAYGLTRSMARSTLTQDMAGTLPEMYCPEPAGLRASLPGMSEFLRTVYQDYLGLRVDLAARALAVQPKLPDGLTDAEFTIHAGTYPIAGRYLRTDNQERMEVRADSLPSPLRVTVIWMMRNGDAWRGGADLNPGVTLTIVFGPGEATLFQGEKKSELEGMRLLKGFSQRKAAAVFTP
jgi:hypothetical protein